MLVEGLSGLDVRHGTLRRAEARVLAAWARERLVACGAPLALAPVVEASETGAPDDSVELELRYANGNNFRFQGDFERGCAHIATTMHGAKTELATAIALLSPEAALAEAMFF